ncbi:MAG: OsmC family protein [Polyangia bacterium]
MTITFAGGLRVDAVQDGIKVETDQLPSEGGEGAAPPPFFHFLASIGTCAGLYVLRFCQVRKIPSDEIRLVQRMKRGKTGRLEEVQIEIEVPPEFPEKYHRALVAAANACSVKKSIISPPEFTVRTVVVD